MTRTLHQRLKYDHGLTVGAPHAVDITHADGRRTRVLVLIPARGFPRVTRWGGGGDMYTSTYRVNPDDTMTLESVKLAAQYADEFRRLTALAVAVVPLTV